MDENDFHHCYGNFFRIAILKVILSQLFSKQHFERHHTVEDFMDLDQDRCEFFHQDLSKHNQTKINEGIGKLSVAQKSKPAPQRTLHCTKTDGISFIFIRFFFLKKLLFKFNPVFSGMLDSLR